MSHRYRVRFAPEALADSFISLEHYPCGKGQRKKTKSRMGCLECKRRRVKCDEGYPMCRQCEHRSVICHSAPRALQWQVEIPWLASTSMDDDVKRLCTENKRLLQYWFQQVSQMMVLDPNENPLSYPIMEHVASSRPLLHAILSVSAAHEHYFRQADLGTSLVHRGLSLSLLQMELTASPKPQISSFLTVLLLGWSCSWMRQDIMDYGKEHLCGARTVLDAILEDASEIDASIHFMAGTYIYWDMSCSFTAHPSELKPLDTKAISSYVRGCKDRYHPVAGHFLEVFYILGNLGRYCRQILEVGSLRDVFLELSFESQLLGWDSSQEYQELYLLGDSFRKHGLIMLHRLCRRSTCSDSDPDSSYGSRPSSSRDGNPDDGQDGILDGVDGDSCDSGYYGSSCDGHSDGHISSESGSQDDQQETSHIGIDDDRLIQTVMDQIIREYALEMVENLRKIPLSSSYFNIQGIPLLTAGSELTKEDVEARREVIKRFKALYSLNRCQVNLWACDLLEDLWEARDSHQPRVTLYDLTLQNGWRWWLA